MEGLYFILNLRARFRNRDPDEVVLVAGLPVSDSMSSQSSSVGAESFEMCKALILIANHIIHRAVQEYIFKCLYFFKEFDTRAAKFIVLRNKELTKDEVQLNRES